jgi:uncharacterized membrane protein YfcA
MSLGTALVALLVGVGSGVVSGLFGVGGGVLMVPAMVLFLDMSQHVAEGTSLLVIIPTAVVGALTLWRRGYVMVRMAAVIGTTGILGALAGSHLALGVPSGTLRLLFGGYLVLIGLRMVVPSRRGMGEEVG